MGEGRAPSFSPAKWLAQGRKPLPPSQKWDGGHKALKRVRSKVGRVRVNKKKTSKKSHGQKGCVTRRGTHKSSHPVSNLLSLLAVPKVKDVQQPEKKNPLDISRRGAR